MVTCPDSRGCIALGRFFPTRLLKPLNPFIGYESHIRYVFFSVVITNQQPLSTVERANKIRGFTIVYRFYFTQCVCMGSIERLTLSLNIYIYIYIYTLCTLAIMQLIFYSWLAMYICTLCGSYDMKLRS